MKPVGVFRQSAVADPFIAKHPLDVPKRVLDLGSDLCFELLGFGKMSWVLAGVVSMLWIKPSTSSTPMCIFIWIAQVIKELHAVNAEDDGRRIRWPASLPFRVVIGYLLLQLLPGNQLVHALQEDLAPGLALLIPVFGFSRGHLVHRVKSSIGSDWSIIADFSSYSEVT